jgi:hypothetical protein
MRLLFQPQVLNRAAPASLVSALACYPRLCLWTHRPELLPIWYMEAAIFVCGVLLWGSVFAWHEAYTHRPIFICKQEFMPVMAVTLAGILTGLAFRAWVDPSLRAQFPEDYPKDMRNWLASLAFLLTFTQLFVVFATFDWLIRLVRNRWLAAGLLGAFGAAWLLQQVCQLHGVVPPGLLTALLLGRMAAGFWVVALYLRGGVWLVSWWSLLVYARHLLDYV